MHARGLQLSLSESLIAHAEENSVAKEVVKHAWDSGALPRGFKWLAAGATNTNSYPARPTTRSQKTRCSILAPSSLVKMPNLPS